MSHHDDWRLEAVIREHIESVLLLVGSKTEAAALLGIGRTTLYRYLKQWKQEDARK